MCVAFGGLRWVFWDSAPHSSLCFEVRVSYLQTQGAVAVQWIGREQGVA